MTVVKNIIFMFGLLPAVFFISACFSPYGKDQAIVTLALSGGGDKLTSGDSSARSLTDIDVSALEHIIELEGSPRNQTINVPAGESSVDISVIPGQWNIWVRAYLINGDKKELCYEGSARIQLKAGKNGPVTIKMNPAFTAVTDITGVLPEAVAGTPVELSGTVLPENATNREIVWSVKDAGTTGAVIEGNILTSAAEGVVTVIATVSGGKAAGEDFVKPFEITVTSALEDSGQGTFTITFAQIAEGAPVITGPTISKTESGGHLYTGEILVDVNEYDPGSIVWYFEGTGFRQTGPSVELDAGNVLFSVPKEYTLTLEVKKDGVPYSADIIITVVE